MIDFKQLNDLEIIAISEEESLIKELQPAFNSIRNWIESITDQKFIYPNDFRKSLADGIVLCNLVNCLKPGAIKRINKISTTISGYSYNKMVNDSQKIKYNTIEDNVHNLAEDNLGKFLRCCEDDFGLSSLILFKLSDLEDLSEKLPSYQLDSEKRLERVLMCLFHLAKSVENHLTTVKIDSAPFNILLKSNHFREMKKKKVVTKSEDSILESPVPELIQKQIPSYLAHKAEETLKQTKINNDILHKSMENDDWQESLENWREKRRQVLSQSMVETSTDDYTNEDSKDLVKLREKARKMKQLRDQIKDQNSISSNDQMDSKSNVAVPDIDDEMKAMIERVKMKKLAEEQKRQFSVSSPLKTSFTSDSDPSTSTPLEKLEDESISVSENNELDRSLSCVDNQLPVEVSRNNPFADDKIQTLNKPLENNNVRLIQIKLSQVSKQNSDQLWGMELISKGGSILVSKVKIGSSSDVCDVQKGDEIVSINSINVENQSIEYAKSVFSKCAFSISPTECITLSLRRLKNDEEDEDFLCSDFSEALEDNLHNVADRAEVEPNSQTHLKECNINSMATVDIEEIGHINMNLKSLQNFPNIINEISETANNKLEKATTTYETVENRRNYGEESLYSVNNISHMDSEIPEITNRDTNETDREFQLSVQAKIAKFECQNVMTNSLNLNSSLNISKSNQNTEFAVNNSKYGHRASCEGLVWNSDNVVAKVPETNHSSISNLYHYWETEAPKSSSSNPNLINKNSSVLQTSIHSLVNEKDRDDKCLLETAELNLSTSNVNVVRPWKNGRSSCNSSTSDDVSALNETVEMSQYGSWNKSVKRNLEKSLNDNEKTSSNLCLTKELSSVTSDLITIEDKVLGSEINPSTRTNVSTGIQANIQSRQQPVYTTITTAFESQSRKSLSNSTSKVSEVDTCSVSSSKFHGNIESLIGNLTPASEMGQPIKSLHLSWLPQSNKNDMSKDLTLISPSVVRQENQQNEVDFSSTRTNGFTLGSLENNEKSIEVEVSIIPKLFPMKNKTLFSKPVDEKYRNHKISDPIPVTRSLDDDETALKSSFIKVTDLDDIISPVRSKPNFSRQLDNNSGSPSKTGDIIYSDITKEDEVHNQTPIYQHNISSSDRLSTELLESNIDVEPTISTVPVPTLFKGSHNSDNTISVGMTLSKSENFNPMKNESVSSTKKSKNSHSKPNELQYKRSSSSKEIRYSQRENPNDAGKSNINYRDNPSSNTTNSRKRSPSQVTFSDKIQDITQTKIQTKTFSIEKSTKTTPISFSKEKKKSKSQNKKSSQPEISTKCNNCLQPAGSEDLMVIEELNLHFHLRCFICSECKVQLGDGKTDTDVRIRRSKLHCAICYNKKSSKSKNKNSTNRQQPQSQSNSMSNKGGHGDGHSVYITPGGSNNNCTAINNISSPSSFIAS